MEVRVLGPVEVVDDEGRTHPVSSPSQRTVLSVLAVHADEVVSTERLIDALWGEAPPPSARSSLRTYVSRLRRVLGDQLCLHPGGYLLRAEVDATGLERLVARLGAGDPVAGSGPSALAEIDAALARWRGEPFAGMEDVDALVGPRARLVEAARAARVARIRALLAVARPAEAAMAAEGLLAEDPLRETTWELLIEALGADGRAAEALRAGQRAREALADAGLEVGPGLRRAESAVLVEAPATTMPRPEPARPSRAGRLPVAVTSLVGRDADVATVTDLCRRCRVVTVVGPGGVGKTRLAVEAAHLLAGDQEWGARFVRLDVLSDPGEVPHALLDGLGLGGDGTGIDDQVDAAAARDLLVVLDNCEHVVDAAAELASALVSHGHGIRLLATSRERLDIPGEQVHELRPLDVATSGTELFLERARATRPDVRLGDPEALARVVAQVDGLPLALEMAASQLATCSIQELADELAEGLGLLADARRGVAPRHRSVADLVDWTTARLADDDRVLFGELSVFAGAMAPDDVAAVTGRPDAGAALRRLAQRSLVSVDDHGPGTAFRMLVPVRACAAEQLAGSGRADRLAAAHAGCVLARARAADAGLRTERQAEAVAEMDRLLPDVRAVHRWSRQHDPALAVALGAALHLYAQSQVRPEVLGWAEDLVAHDDVVASAAPEDAVVVLATAGHAAGLRGDMSLARDRAERALAIPGGEAGRWAAREVASDVALFEGRLADAAEEAGPLDRLPRDPHALVVRAMGHALAAAYGGDDETGDAVLEVVRGHPAPAPTDRAWVAYAEGEVLSGRDPAAGMAAYARAIELADSVGDRYVGGVARVSSCALMARQGDPLQAARAFAEAIEHWRRHSALNHLVTALRNLPVLLQRLDLPLAAAELLAALDRVDTAPTWGDERDRMAAVGTWIEDRLPAAERSRASASGAARSLDEAARAVEAVLR